MAKNGLQITTSSISSSTVCPTCSTEPDSSTSCDLTLIHKPILLLPDLIDPFSSSTSSFDLDGSLNSLLDDEFEIPNFQNFELSLVVPLGQVSHNLEFSHLSKMESDCEEVKTLSIKDDDGISNQKNILKMLAMISNQMMHNYQDLQNQLVQHFFETN